MDKISRCTIEKCQETFKHYDGIKKYKLINLFFNLMFVIPFILLYGIYKYNDYSDNLEILFVIMLISISLIVLITKKIKYIEYNKRIQLSATQYTSTNFETINVLEDNNCFKILQNKQEIISIKKTKIVEIIKVDDVNLIIYSQGLGFLNFIITK
ncbi:MAG: hypothetical protein ACRDAU_17760 [Clostridium sp.]